jgi:hypothetical protein
MTSFQRISCLEQCGGRHAARNEEQTMAIQLPTPIDTYFASGNANDTAALDRS